jgi:hypothetical protein
MRSPESQQLQDTVRDLIAETQRGYFQWRSVNPSTYVCDAPASEGRTAARLILQRIERILVPRAGTPHKETHYLLQGNEITAQGGMILKLSISGAENPEINELLDQLYQSLLSGSGDEGLEFLKSLLGKS